MAPTPSGAGAWYCYGTKPPENESLARAEGIRLNPAANEGLMLINEVVALQSFLNDEIVNDESLLSEITRQLAAGKLITIRRAFKEPFARRMFQCLDEYSAWAAFEDFSQDYFQYRHHNIYESARAPVDLRLCEQIFDSNATKAFVQRLSGRDCSGRVALSASWYLPGDYSLPHTDRVGAGSRECRQVAFVWHLTKTWQPNWGGDLFW